MNRFTRSLLLLLLASQARAQVPDFTASKPVPISGSSKNNQSVHQANAAFDYYLRVPHVVSWTLNGGKDSAGVVAFNTALGKFGVYAGNGVWQTFLNPADLSPYLKSADAASTYQLKGSYLLSGALNGYATQDYVNGQGFLLPAALNPFLKSADAAGIYQLKGSYLLSGALNGYATQDYVNGQGFLLPAALNPFLKSADAASIYQSKGDFFPRQVSFLGSTSINTALSTGVYRNENGAGGSINYSPTLVLNSGDTGLQINGGYISDGLQFRGWYSNGAYFTPWRKVWHDGNFDPNSKANTSGSYPGIAAGSAANADKFSGYTFDGNAYDGGFDFLFGRTSNVGQFRLISSAGIKAFLSLGAFAYRNQINGNEVLTDRLSQAADINVSKYMRWRNYGDNHIIFDASLGTDPDGRTIDRTVPQVETDGLGIHFPTLMGYNGQYTYGVRVSGANRFWTASHPNDYYSSINFDGTFWQMAVNHPSAINVGHSSLAASLENDAASMRFHWSGQAGQPAWLWGGNDPANIYVYNPANFSVARAGSAAAIDNQGPFATKSRISYLTDIDGIPDKPFIPTDNSQIGNGRGYLTAESDPGVTTFGKTLNQNVSSGAYPNFSGLNLVSGVNPATQATAGQTMDQGAVQHFISSNHSNTYHGLAENRFLDIGYMPDFSGFIRLFGYNPVIADADGNTILKYNQGTGTTIVNNLQVTGSVSGVGIGTTKGYAFQVYNDTGAYAASNNVIVFPHGISGITSSSSITGNVRGLGTTAQLHYKGCDMDANNIYLQFDTPVSIYAIINFNAAITP